MTLDKWIHIFPMWLVLSLMHWGLVMHICISKLIIIGPDYGLLPGRHQAIIWTTGGILLIRPLGKKLQWNFNRIPIFSFKKKHLKVLSATWWPFCLSLDVLRYHLIQNSSEFICSFLDILIKMMKYIILLTASPVSQGASTKQAMHVNPCIFMQNQDRRLEMASFMQTGTAFRKLINWEELTSIILCATFSQIHIHILLF